MPARNGVTAATVVDAGFAGVEDVFSGDCMPSVRPTAAAAGPTLRMAGRNDGICTSPIRIAARYCAARRRSRAWRFTRTAEVLIEVLTEVLTEALTELLTSLITERINQRAAERADGGGNDGCDGVFDIRSTASAFVLNPDGTGPGTGPARGRRAAGSRWC